MIIETIINRIQSFPWDTIKSSIGNCENVGKYIIGLSSDDLIIRNSNYRKLDNLIVVQGSLFEGAFYSIPFLISFLHLEKPIFANKIYDLLFEIANGNSQFESYVSYTIRDEFLIYPNVKDNSNKQHIPIACRYLILKYIDIYLEEIKSNSNNSRKEALSLVSSFDEFRGILIEPLSNLKNTIEDLDIINEINDILDEFIEGDDTIILGPTHEW